MQDVDAVDASNLGGDYLIRLCDVWGIGVTYNVWPTWGDTVSCVQHASH